MSSPIQTLLSVLDSHQIMPNGSRTCLLWGITVGREFHNSCCPKSKKFSTEVKWAPCPEDFYFILISCFILLLYQASVNKSLFKKYSSSSASKNRDYTSNNEPEPLWIQGSSGIVQFCVLFSYERIFKHLSSFWLSALEAPFSPFNRTVQHIKIIPDN